LLATGVTASKLAGDRTVPAVAVPEMLELRRVSFLLRNPFVNRRKKMRVWLTGALVMGVLFLGNGVARAERTPMTRTPGQYSTGARLDHSVPYLTTGSQAFGAYSVAPRIYASPTVDDPTNPQVKPVFNLPFYGSVQSFGDASNGAQPRSTRLTPR
jgi:hypothetical protein